MHSVVDIDTVLSGLERDRERHITEGRILRELGPRSRRSRNLLAVFGSGIEAIARLPRLWSLPNRAAEPCRVEAGV